MADTLGRSAERSSTPPDLSGFLAWLANAPEGACLPAATIHGILAAIATGADVSRQLTPARTQEQAPTTWRERIWTAPAETRLGVLELAEAIGRPKSWVYRHTSRKAGQPPLPHRKLDGELLLLAGEIRTWICEHKETVQPGNLDAPVLSLTRTKVSW